MDRMPVSPLVTRVIEVAGDKIGLAEVALRINSPVMLIEAWRDGLATIPRDKFLRLIDVLTELDPSWAEWDGT